MLVAYARVSAQDQQPALSKQDIQQARALLEDPHNTVEQLAKRLGVGASTLYRHLPGGRSRAELDQS